MSTRSELRKQLTHTFPSFSFRHAGVNEMKDILAGSPVPATWANGKSSSKSESATRNPADEGKLIEAIITAVSGRIEAGVSREEIEDIIDDKLELVKPTVIDVTLEAGKIKRTDITGQHKSLELLTKCVSVGSRVMLVGRAGSGKTTGAEKAAEILGLAFTPISLGPQTSKSDLLGYMDANGRYNASLFRKAFEGGGVVLLDEIDSANPAVLTIINSALANGYCSFPDAVVKRHEGFRCVAAANTWGRGADRTYVGRAQLDGATLDRFIAIEWDYDEDLEKRIVGNDEWTNEVQRMRANADRNQVRHVISPRASIEGAKLLAIGISKKTVIDIVVRKGLDQTAWDKIK